MQRFVISLALLLPSLYAQAYVGVRSLHQVVNDSDAIYIAKVIEISEYKSYKIAKAQVHEILKGPRYENVFYLASSTWNCDISHAELGDDVVLMLYENADRIIFDLDKYMEAEFSSNLSPAEALRRSETQLPLANTNSERFYELAFSGRGYIQISADDTSRRVEVTDDLFLPDDMKSQKSKLGYGYVSADLNEFIAVVKDAVARPDTSDNRYAWFREWPQRLKEMEKEEALQTASTLRHGR